MRYSWLDAGIDDTPFAAATTDSTQCIFQHETGYDDNESKMSGVFVESADIDLGDGENFSFIKEVVPDVKFVIDPGIENTPAINLLLKRRNFPGEALVTDSTTQLLTDTTFKSLRSRARQVVLRFASDDDLSDTDAKGYKWRLGSTRLEIQPSGRR